MSATQFPPPGLYRTTVPLPGKEQAVPGGRLVFFQDRTDHGRPAVLLPKEVVDNRWVFHTQGYLVDSDEWPATLVALPRQGFYSLRKEIAVGGGQKLPEGLLVQLGFTPEGVAVIFPGYLEPGNAIRFPKQGAKLSDLYFDELQVHEFRLIAREPMPGTSNQDPSGASGPPSGTA
jgi:hypothetical protein